MVRYFFVVYVINRTLHDRLEIRNFFSRVEKIFHSFVAPTHEIFFNSSKRSFVSPHSHIISSIYCTIINAKIYLLILSFVRDFVIAIISFNFISFHLWV